MAEAITTSLLLLAIASIVAICAVAGWLVVGLGVLAVRGLKR